MSSIKNNLELGPPGPELLVTACTELRETAGVREEAIRQLRELIEGEQLLIMSHNNRHKVILEILVKCTTRRNARKPSNFRRKHARILYVADVKLPCGPCMRCSLICNTLSV